MEKVFSNLFNFSTKKLSGYNLIVGTTMYQAPELLLGEHKFQKEIGRLRILAFAILLLFS